MSCRVLTEREFQKKRKRENVFEDGGQPRLSNVNLPNLVRSGGLEEGGHSTNEASLGASRTPFGPFIRLPSGRRGLVPKITPHLRYSNEPWAWCFTQAYWL
jgi:hypothetical protein